MCPANRTVHTCIQMDMEKIIICCNADYLQYEFPKRKWYRIRQCNRIALMRLAFAEMDTLECDILLEVHEDYIGEPLYRVEDSFRDDLYEAMIRQCRKNCTDAEHLILMDNGEDLSEWLYPISDNRNFLSIRTDNPGWYEEVTEQIEESYGLMPVFFSSKRELLRYIKQMPEKKKIFLISGNAYGENENYDGSRKGDKNMSALVCGLPKDSFLMDFSNSGIFQDLIFKKRLQITYVSIPIFLDNIVKNRYNAVVNEGITFQVKKDKKHVWRRKGNEDGRKEKYPDL